jgi:hypothetical protein
MPVTTARYPRYVVVDTAGTRLTRQYVDENAVYRAFTQELYELRRWGPTGSWRGILQLDNAEHIGRLIRSDTA